MRVVIADEHEVVRIGLRTVLQRSGEGYELTGESASGSELLELLADTPCDLVIVDFQMPEDTAALAGVMLLRELRHRFPTLRIVVLTTSHSTTICRAMYREGVDAVVEKASMVDELLVALRTVRAGNTYVGKPLREQGVDISRAAKPPSSTRDKRTLPLSMREAEVIRLLAEGLSVSEVARITHRSVKTVSWQKHSAMAKLGIGNDQQLFDYARTRGLV
ncbi:response regulator transcription factor [Dyella sp.]|uniref:response regulator transcription factor n=1 Tax=Dyella sp. TaxID=1869338 RepID=UPI002D7796F3|nr:response regulator transcription factor [Dyella sp.]HET7330596.1 response regulator transcription factor [Dyella sp.]